MSGLEVIEAGIAIFGSLYEYYEAYSTAATIGKAVFSPFMVTADANGTQEISANPKAIKKWLMDGEKMIWVSKNKADCYKPYNFKNNDYVTTPFPVGDYSYTTDEADKSFKISGWTNEWYYKLTDIQHEGKTLKLFKCVSSPGNAHNGVVLTDRF